mmetsp:Transcript_11515/g.22730  ORF Transcript_11515/g.22730 Transcript_11515/m.22730 type:complete len:210 (-) Transcript_11515:115-744(-)
MAARRCARAEASGGGACATCLWFHQDEAWMHHRAFDRPSLELTSSLPFPQTSSTALQASRTTTPQSRSTAETLRPRCLPASPPHTLPRNRRTLRLIKGTLTLFDSHTRRGTTTQSPPPPTPRRHRAVGGGSGERAHGGDERGGQGSVDPAPSDRTAERAQGTPGRAEPRLDPVVADCGASGAAAARRRPGEGGEAGGDAAIGPASAERQ